MEYGIVYLLTNPVMPGLSIGFGILVKHALGHLGIAMDALEILIAHLLDIARCHYSLAYGGRRLSRFERRQLIEGDRLYLAQDIYTGRDFGPSNFIQLINCT